MKILFVCLGNICRSPMAEAVFKHHCPKDWIVDSAGTAGYHKGNSPDNRTLETLEKNNIHTEHRARQIFKDDFMIFDYILCMDRNNLKDLMSIVPKGSKAKVMMFAGEEEIKDPYYGEMDGFEINFNQCLESTKRFLKTIDN